MKLQNISILHIVNIFPLSVLATKRTTCKWSARVQQTANAATLQTATAPTLVGNALCNVLCSIRTSEVLTCVYAGIEKDDTSLPDGHVGPGAHLGLFGNHFTLVPVGGDDETVWLKANDFTTLRQTPPLERR